MAARYEMRSINQSNRIYTAPLQVSARWCSLVSKVCCRSNTIKFSRHLVLLKFLFIHVFHVLWALLFMFFHINFVQFICLRNNENLWWLISTLLMLSIYCCPFSWVTFYKREVSWLWKLMARSELSRKTVQLHTFLNQLKASYSIP